MMENLKGKRGLIFGLANERSIAYGIAKLFHESGAKLAFNYQSYFKDRVEKIVQDFNPDYLAECDVSSDESFAEYFNGLKKVWDTFDFVIHSVAFADKNELIGSYLQTSRQGFNQALDISCYSFTKLAQHSAEFMINGGSMVTLSYYGANKYIKNYNVMGVAKAALEASVRYLSVDLGPSAIRVNAISAGPVKTLAAVGISDFRKMLEHTKNASPLRRNVGLEDIAYSAAFLVSDYSKNITAEILNVDCGYNSISFNPYQDEE